ncbi:MAG: hypothetical protein DRI57_05125 [Deltaproteobacteria bacterium]|nr:MAG: hypothetical protein DRI57_05125 [Deltaproteobacteria bacterium]
MRYMVEPDNNPKPLCLLSCFPFFLAAFLMLLLCMKGGFSGLTGEHPLRLSWFSLPAGGFILVFSMSWLLCLILFLLFPRGLSASAGRILLVSLAILVRLVLLPHEAPDDINRCLREGRLLHEGFIYVRNDPTLAGTGLFHVAISHSDLPAAYPQFMLYIFSLAARVKYSPLPMRILMILSDLGTLMFLMGLLRYRCLNLRWAVLYAFSPVILYSFAGQGHSDSAQNFFLIGALYLYDRKRWGWMFLFAGMAVQSKCAAVITLPFLMRRDNWKYAGLTFIIILLPCLPFITDDGMKVFFCLGEFGDKYAFNGSVHWLLVTVFRDIPPATRFCKILLAGSLIFGYLCFHPQRSHRFRDDPVSGCFFVLGALLLLSPAVHFRHLSCIIPFLALRPTIFWILLSLTISGSFVANGVLHHTGIRYLPVWVQIAEWGPVWILLVRDAIMAWHRAMSPADVPPRSVSVIIPVRNEAGSIRECIESLLRDKAVHEVIVVDGGSSDKTPFLAQKAGARVIEHAAPPEHGEGRGGQIHAGIMAAKGDVVAIVHADALVTAPTFTRMVQLLRRQPMIAGGAVGGVFDAAGWRLRALEFANEIRMVCLGISFGDQIQFFRRRPVVEKDIFPAIPLMEDVEFSLRLHHLGRQTFFFGEALISTRRWKTKGYRHSLLAIRLCVTYLWQRLRGKADTQAMYRRYYG